ncbi:hypothetical protein BaRGS_00002651 [Batillaria attramentaria]|uniref:Uncharacterized protein n=1 Tax=Batillaria attramentaria TaxID=370345 RepID=A0ABD0M3J9_9CAEN
MTHIKPKPPPRLQTPPTSLLRPELHNPVQPQNTTLKQNSQAFDKALGSCMICETFKRPPAPQSHRVSSRGLDDGQITQELVPLRIPNSAITTGQKLYEYKLIPWVSEVLLEL